MWRLRSLRFGILIIFSCIFIRTVSDYEVTDHVLISFPMYPIFIFFNALEEKYVASILFSFFVCVIFWMPIKKGYNSIYGILIIERCKVFFLLVGYIFVFIGATFFQRSYLGEGWGLFISIIYFIWLQCGLKMFDNKEFLSYIGIGNPIKESGRDYIVALIINCVVYLILAAEINSHSNDARMAIDQVRVEGAIVKDISLDGRNVLFVDEWNSSGSPSYREKRKVGLIDFEKKEISPIDIVENCDFMKFVGDDQYICVSEVNYGSKTKILSFYNWGTKGMRKIYQLEDNRNVSIKEIKLNQNSKYLFTMGSSASLWNCRDEERIDTYKPYSAIAWMGCDDYAIVQIFNDSTNQLRAEVSWNKILENGNIEKKIRGQIGKDIEYKMRGWKRSNKFMKEINEQFVCIVTTGVPQNNFLNYESYIAFWDIKNEKKIFSINSGNEVLDVVFHPSNSQFIVIERMKNKKLRIGFWDINKKKREKMIFLEGISGNSDGWQFKVIENGKKMVLLENNFRIWNID